jgi:hypothetical protein
MFFVGTDRTFFSSGSGSNILMKKCTAYLTYLSLLGAELGPMQQGVMFVLASWILGTPLLVTGNGALSGPMASEAAKMEPLVFRLLEPFGRIQLLEHLAFVDGMSFSFAHGAG